MNSIHAIASLEELRIVWNFDEAAYGAGENISFALFQEWWCACPLGLVAAYRDGKPVAVIGLLPVTADWVEKLIAREVTEKDLSAEVIRSSRRLNWYLSGISLARRTKGLSRLPMTLICGSLQLWYHENYDLLRQNPIQIVSVGTTNEGHGLLRKVLGFEIVSAGINEDTHPIFAREITGEQLSAFLIESSACKGFLDPLLLADIPRGERPG